MSQNSGSIMVVGGRPSGSPHRAAWYVVQAHRFSSNECGKQCTYTTLCVHAAACFTYTTLCVHAAACFTYTTLCVHAAACFECESRVRDRRKSGVPYGREWTTRPATRFQESRLRSVDYSNLLLDFSTIPYKRVPNCTSEPPSPRHPPLLPPKLQATPGST